MSKADEVRRDIFLGGPDDTGAEVILRPYGSDEIWIKDGGGRTYRIKAHRGPHGFGLTISSPANTMTIFGTRNSTGSRVNFDTNDLELCIYEDTKKAQDFKKWYSNPSKNPHPDEPRG